MTRMLTFWLVIGTASLAAAPAQAQSVTMPVPTCRVSITSQDWPLDWSDPNCRDLRDRDPFSAGACSFQFLSGYQAMKAEDSGGPTLDYLPQSFRFGFMVSSPAKDPDCWYRGNFEVLLEAFYAPILEDIGSYITGPTALLRYNCVHPQCLVIPYLQGGAGMVFTGAWQTADQQLFEDDTAFLLRADVGARVMLSDCLSIDLEAGFRYLTSSRISDGNNSVGASLGFTYFFAKP